MATAKKTTKSTASVNEAFPTLDTEMFKDGFEKMSQGFEKVAEFQKESFDAVVATTTKVAGSIEDISKDQVAFAKSSFEDGVKAAQAVAKCKSPQEVMEVNTEFFRSAFESNLAQFNKISEMVVASSKEAVSPLTDSYNNFVETVQAYRP